MKVQAQEQDREIPEFNRKGRYINNLGNGEQGLSSFDGIEVEDEKLVESESLIFKQWYNFMRLLRLVGNCPLSLHRNVENPSQITVEFQLVSWATAYGVILGLLRVSICLAYYRNWGFVVLGRRYENTMEDWIVRSMNVALPFYQFWDLFSIWITANGSAKLCNTWMNFEIGFRQVFAPHYTYSCKIKKFRRTLVYLILIPLLFLGSILLVEFVTYAGNADHKSIQGLIGSYLLRFLPAPIFVITLLMEDIRALLMYKTLTEAYENLRHGIESEVRTWAQRNIGLVTEGRVAEWKHLLLAIRRHGKTTGGLQTLQQIAVLIHTVVVSTEVLFFIINATMGGRNIITTQAIIFGGIGIMYIMRLISKIIVAEGISEEEKKVAEAILEQDSSKFDILAKLETKKIVDMILQSPMKISLSGYVSMEKRMLPKVTSYVVAYLVVLVQFKLSNKEILGTETTQPSATTTGTPFLQGTE